MDASAHLPAASLPLPPTECCIFHRQRQWGDWSDDEDSDAECDCPDGDGGEQPPPPPDGTPA